MNDLQRVSTDQLAQMVREAEQLVQEIRTELDRREQRGQHREVERLDVHLANAQVRWPEVRAFFRAVLDELRR